MQTNLVAAVPDIFDIVNMPCVTQDKPGRFDSVFIERVQDFVRIFGRSVIKGKVDDLFRWLDVVCARACQGAVLFIRRQGAVVCA